MTARRKTRQISVGGVTIGGDAPIRVQSMTCTDTRDVKATVRQITELAEYGCELVRLAVPDFEAARALKDIKKQVKVPLIADIHYDYRLALMSIEAGIDGLRLNPGNISDPEKVTAVVKAAKERQIPIRIGINAGSLPNPSDPSMTIPQRMVASAMEQVKLLESLDFDLIKVSLKAFDVPTTIEAYSDIADKIPYPLHVGITEAGTPRTGVIRSAVGIGTLLYMGIGDTIRVSLTATDRKQEVFTAWEILKSLNLRERGPVLVSCPTCGRTEVDITVLANRVEDALMKIDKPIKVAVMGCIVNGPGEAKDADVGIALSKKQGVIFRKGDRVRTVEEKDFFKALMEEIAIIIKE
jgi:(E)-4-hydroxy-3-methylbut-2-enyl-diphosphate synthase